MFEGSVVIIKYERDWAHWRHLHHGWLQCRLLVWRSLLQNPHCGISSHFIVTTSLEKWQGWSTETYTCRICLRSIWTKCNRFSKPNTVPRLCFGVLRGNWLNLFFFFFKTCVLWWWECGHALVSLKKKYKHSMSSLHMCKSVILNNSQNNGLALAMLL